MNDQPPAASACLGRARFVSRCAVVVVVALVLSAQALSEETEISLPAPEPIQHARFVEVTPVSAGFRERIEGALDTIPESVWRDMTRHGWQIHLASQVTDAAPQLRGHRPRGWPEDAKWENTDAVHLAREKLVVVAELRETTSGEMKTNSRVEGLLRHEMGHAFDVASGRGALRSASSAFQEAYRMDLDEMTPEMRSQLAYYVQPDEAGAQETFAEAFGILLGGGCDAANREAFEESFPTVLEVVESAINEPEKPPARPQQQKRERRFRLRSGR